MIRKFNIFEQIVDLGPLKTMEYDPKFLEEWDHLMSMYNEYGKKLDDFFIMIENDVHMLSASGYSVGKIDNGLTKEETKKFMQLKAKIIDKMDVFAQEFGKAKMTEEKFKMGPTHCFLVNGKQVTEKMPIERLKEIIYSPNYKIIAKYFNEIWRAWENFESIYSNLYRSLKTLIADNPIDMFTDFQELIEKSKSKMADKAKFTELPSLT